MSANAINNRIGSASNTDPLTIERSSSGLFIDLNDQTDNFGLYNNAGTPEGVVAADIGSQCMDTTNGNLYIKKTDTVNTGWSLLDTGPATAPTSWTPALEFGGASVGITYTNQLGIYTHIGNIITFSFRIILSSKGSSTGPAFVTNLPAIGNNLLGAPIQIIAMVSSSFTFDTGRTNLFGIPSIGAAELQLLQSGGSVAVTTVTDVNFANNTQIWGSGTYFTN